MDEGQLGSDDEVTGVRRLEDTRVVHLRAQSASPGSEVGHRVILKGAGRDPRGLALDHL